jgi:hypothetical protein
MQIWMRQLGICKILNTNLLISPVINARHPLPDPHAASVEQTALEATHFQKCVYMQDVLCDVIESVM